MFEVLKNEPIKVTPSSEFGLTTTQREKIQRACGVIEGIGYIYIDADHALTYAVEEIDTVLAEDAERKRGVPCE